MAIAPSLHQELQNISEKCINCDLCQKECTFLQKYGKPKHIADSYDPDNKEHQGMAFECSLCHLCASVCPVNINPADMFLEIRREASRNGCGNYPEHGSILGYENRGTSQRYTYYALPEGCHTILFPGCTLPGTRPDKTWTLFEHLRKTIPDLGIVLDCCTKPSHDLGRDQYFTAMFGEMKAFLIDNGIQNVLVACPNCYKVFSKYGGQLSVKTIYEFMAQNGLPTNRRLSETVTVHDPCTVRHDKSIQKAVRDLCQRQGLTLQEMPHHKDRTLCCGEGGSVGLITPDFANQWSALRKGETNGHRIITYCAGCFNRLNNSVPTSHVIDLLFQPKAAIAGTAKVSKAPVTYLNRIRLKKRLKSKVDAAITRERTLTIGKEGKKKAALVKRIVFIAILISSILAVRFAGASQYL